MPKDEANYEKLTFSQVQPFDRLSLARRLHETLAQNLAVIGYDLDALIGDETLNPSQRADLRSIRLQVMEVTKSFRDEIYRTRTLNRSEVASEIKSILSEITTIIDMSYPALSDESENLLNEVIIEIARNTRKHSSANSFYIKFELTDSGFLLLLGDDGSGAINFKKSATDHESFGLRGIDELLKVIASDYQCRSDKSGTHFRIAFPLQRAQ